MVQRSRQSKSGRIAADLRKRFSQERIVRGRQVQSAAELAREYGVSLPTAHNALNLLVRDGLLYRIQGSGTFFNRDSLEKTLRIGIADQTLSTEFLTPEINRVLNYHFDWAAQWFREHACDVRIITYAELMAGHALDGLDGVLANVSFLDPASVSRFRKGVPVVFYRCDYPEESGFPVVSYGLESGIREALDHLRLAPADRIVMVFETTRSCLAGRDRLREELRRRGIARAGITEYPVEVPEREISCYRLVRSRTREFAGAAVLCGNDEIAVNVVNALNLEGLEGGRDYRLIGIGNRGGYGETAAARLRIASIDMPIRLMAEEAARQLLYRIANPSECVSHVTVPTRFIARRTAERSAPDAPRET